jgi:Flp pilus assembly protein TadG
MWLLTQFSQRRFTTCLAATAEIADSNPISVTIMFGASTISRVRGTAGRFIRADQGNIAVTFAIALLPMLGFIGAAIDYSRANRARSSMQAALDSTALMLSKDFSQGLITASQVDAKAQTYFTALYTDADSTVAAGNIHGTYTASDSSGASTIVVTGSGYVVSDFMKVAGFPQLNFNTSSTAAWGSVRMRVAMALDNTGSMASDGKMPALQTAAKSLIDQLSPLAKNAGDIYISIVPFAKDVNMGSTNSNQTWIDWTDWEAEAPDLVGSSNKPSNWSSYGPGSNCPWSMRNDGFTCMTGPNSLVATATIPNSGTYKGYICPGPDKNSNYGFAYHYLINGCYDSVKSGSTYTHPWLPNAHSTWSGCLADRTQPYDVQGTAPTSSTVATLFPAEQYYENSESFCVTGNTPPLQAITPLSYNWTALKTAIDAMSPTGGTNQPIGLAWGWQTLLSQAPFNAPAKQAGYTYKDAIILLSDGLNTENRWPAYGNGSSQTGTMIDDRQKIMCDNAKAAGITIYTIQVNTGSPADPTSTVLQYCASGADKFYLITAASQTVAAFNSIGTSLSKLRVAK